MTFTVIKNLVFIDSMQSMSFSLDVLVKNLSKNDLKYLSQQFTCELLELVKQKWMYPYKHVNKFKRFSDDKLADRREFHSSLKDKCTCEKNYLHAANVWNIIKMKTMVDYHYLYLKTYVLLLDSVLFIMD